MIKSKTIYVLENDPSHYGSETEARAARLRHRLANISMSLIHLSAKIALPIALDDTGTVLDTLEAFVDAMSAAAGDVEKAFAGAISDAASKETQSV